MTELHPEAVACTGCGAQKEARLSYLFGSLALGFGIIAVLCVMGGAYKTGAVFLLATLGVARAGPKHAVWVRRNQRSPQ